LKIDKQQILAQVHTQLGRPKQFWAALGVAGISLFGMVAAFGTAPTTDEIRSFQQTVIEEIAAVDAVAIDASGETFMHEERIRHGDTVMALLSRLGIRDADAIEYLRANADTQSLFRQLSPGKNVTARVGTQGELQSLIFPLNGGKDMALTVERVADGFAAAEQALQLETQIVRKSAEINYSLFGATDAAGIPDSVAMQLADIFGGDIDFHRDLRKGDRFSVIYESVNHLGKQVRTGRILATEFVNGSKTYRAIWFQGDDGQGGYYSADGKNIRKAFLRSPLEFSRVTSGFSSARFHPVLQKWRAHKGIDYGAPTGTRVRATGDGTVEFVGSQGGYGNVVILRHQGRYTTLYGHLSGFGVGLRKGARVSQGDIIGFVGATGVATGPHLHYEFRIGDTHQNPLAMALPSAPPLSAQQLAEFQETARVQLAQIDMIRGSYLARLD
jgi:murein DD-endopeptidase MepM/ murein hydrolase activator NlpD